MPVAKKRPLKEIVIRKLREPNTVFLLGGGASFCAGLPGVLRLTNLVQSRLRNESRRTFDETVRFLIKKGIENPNIEEILSELYHRLSALTLRNRDKGRYETTFRAVCQCIRSILKVDGPTEYHKEFVSRIVSRRKSEPAKKAPPVQIFTTNYDLLIELACDESQIVAINGFEGIFLRRWNPRCFDYDIGKATNHVQTPRFEPSARHIRLYKLHGSLSWFEENGQFYEDKETAELKRTPLVIYPSRLKYAESIRPPFDWLFRRFGTVLSEARLLICIGYRFADESLNQYIFTGLNNGLSLLALSKGPIDALGDRSKHPRVSLINEQSTIIDGNDQNEATNLWAFENFAKWLPALRGK